MSDIYQNIIFQSLWLVQNINIQTNRKTDGAYLARFMHSIYRCMDNRENEKTEGI